MAVNNNNNNNKYNVEKRGKGKQHNLSFNIEAAGKNIKKFFWKETQDLKIGGREEYQVVGNFISPWKGEKLMSQYVHKVCELNVEFLDAVGMVRQQ